MERSITAYSRLYDFKAIVNGGLVYYQENIIKFADFVKAVYKQEQIAWPKFYKMDALSKLGFMGVELLLKERTLKSYNPESVGVVLSNSSSSLDTDLAHQETISDRAGYFPSPSVFVYTLPNIVIGEICIRNNIKGENAFLIHEKFNGKLLFDYVDELFENKRVKACLCGWVEVLGNNFDAMVALVEEPDTLPRGSASGFNPMPFNVDNLNLIMKRN